MWGKVRQIPTSGGDQGITPAHAGKRTCKYVTITYSKDHPRACGEKSTERPTGRPKRGSPPRMRGKAKPFREQFKYAGITPAHAGKRMVLLMRWSIVQDHPRACGEKGLSSKLPYVTPGSPPRMRGKVENTGEYPILLGITPAHAGKSLSSIRHVCKD